MSIMMRLISRVVLVTYTAQLLAPVVYAMEGPIFQGQSDFSRRLDRPSRQEQKLQAGLQKTLKSQAALLKGAPTLSIHLDQLPGNNLIGQYRLSISQTRWSTSLSGQRPVQTTDYNWYQDISAQSRSSVIHHPWMQYLKLKLEDSGLLSVQSLQSTSDTFPSGYYSSFHYDFSVATDLKLSNILTDGTIKVRKSQQLYIQETVYGKKGVTLQADKGIQTHPLQMDRPTWLGSDVSMTLTTSFLDNAYSTIYAPVVKGVLGKTGQQDMCLDNTHGVIQADDLLNLSVTAPVINTHGFMECRFGTTHMKGDGPLHNDHGQVRGKKQLLVNLKGGIHNETGHLWSRGKTDIHAKDMESTQGAEVSGHNLTLTLKQALKTDQTSHFKADDKINITAQTLDHQSPFQAPTVSIHTIDGISLGAQSLENLTLVTQQGPVSYPPKGLEISGLLSMTSKNVPLFLTVPLNSPGAFEATAPEIIKQTKMAFKKHITLNGTSTQVDYPVRSEGHLVSDTKGLTVNAQGFSHTCGQLSLAEDLVFEGQNLKLRGVTKIGGTLPIINTGKRDISYKHLHVDGLLQLTLPPLQQELTTPLKITGRLELDRQGNSPKPLSLLADLIAKKGIKVRVPSAHVIAGSENAKDLVKLQAEDGSLEIESKSLDIVKAQLFARTGMRWKVQEKEIHVGRGVSIDTPMMCIFESLCTSPHYEGSSLEVFLSSFLKPYFPNLPFKRSNGTHVVTEGPFTIQSPEGVCVDQSEIHVGQNHDLTITTQKPVRNEGGKISVRDIIINNTQSGNHSGSVFQNNLLFNSVCISPQGAAYNLSYPYCQLPMLIVNGKFVAGRLENNGGFIHITEPLSCQVIEKDMTATCRTPCTATDFFFSKSGIPTDMHLIYPGSLSAPKGIMNQNAVSPQLEGNIQTSFFVTAFEGKAMVGKVVNYRRPETQPFQQIKRFMDLPHSTAMFQPVMNSSLPWINQPTVPLSWGIQLPPAVGFGPHGLYLLDRSNKLLLHPLQEVGDLPCVFNAQLRRGYLDDEHPETLATYIMGRQQAYMLYQKFFAPKAVKGANPTQAETNPERALQALDSTLATSLTEEDIDQLKFMMLYYAMPYDGKTVYLPASWLSKKYDDPRVRNPDGGIFASRVAIFKGKTPHDILHCVSSIHGESLLGIDVAQTILEQQNFSYIAYLTNTTIEEGSWFKSDKVRSQTFALQVSEAQSNTGRLSTGDKGQFAMRGGLDMCNGPSIDVGKKGVTGVLTKLKATPSDDTSVACATSHAGRTNSTHYYQTHQLRPASIHSEGGLSVTIEDMDEVTALQVVAPQGDIKVEVKNNANLLAHQVEQSSGRMVSKQGAATVTQEMFTPLALPCSFLALNGNVVFIVGGKLYGVAPHFMGKQITLDAKETDITSLLMANRIHMTSKTEGMFSTQASTSSQETPSMMHAIFEGDEVHIRGEKGKFEGALIKAKVLHDHTIEGLILAPLIREFHYSQQTLSKSPFASSDVGSKGGYESMVPTILMVDKVVRHLDNDAQMLFNSVEWDRDRTEVIGKFAETTYQLKQWQTSWNKTDQLIPDAALVVVALGISIATQGWGTTFAAETLGFGTIASELVGVGIASIASQAGTSYLQSGDPLNAAASLFTDQYLRSLATTILTSGGGAGALQGFTQRLMANALKAVVRASVSSVIEKRDFGTALKETSLSALVDTISGSIAEKIGQKAHAKIDPSSPIEHKLAHFALGCGTGLATGAILGHDNLLAAALTSGAGAVIGECVAEALADREQLMQEAKVETVIEKGFMDEEYCRDIYRKKLQPYVDTGRLVAGAVIATTGRDPTLAISASTNALENNFAGTPYPELMDPDVAEVLPDATIAVGKSIVDTAEAMYEYPDPYVEAVVLDAIPYGDISHRYYMGKTVSNFDLATETLIVASGTNYAKASGRIALKAAKNFGTHFAKRLDEAKHLRKVTANKNSLSRNAEGLDLADTSLRAKNTSTRSKLFGTDQVYTFKANRVRSINGRAPINADYAGKTYDFSRTNLAKRIEGLKDRVKIEELTKKYVELNKKYPHGVPFTGTGHPDFSRYAVKKVEIRVTGDHQIDFALANKASGLRSTPRGLTWHHHQDGKSMQLVPKDLHNTIRHTGGVAIVKGNI